MGRVALAFIVGLTIMVQPSSSFAQRAPDASTRTEQQGDEDRSKLTDVAIVALIIAASITLYKSTGRPCACPSDTMRNGAACGNRSAWAKPGGAKPLCYPTDITGDMIKAYRATKTIPAVW